MNNRIEINMECIKFVLSLYKSVYCDYMQKVKEIATQRKKYINKIVFACARKTNVKLNKVYSDTFKYKFKNSCGKHEYISVLLGYVSQN